ncbi:hypothetical protein [Halomonas sp. CSM-2]|uniref:hypothetical protein n=1 Tax=Halomonas sp. CSM-2 TaxID=1975722 RepID=UPI000A283856|nr:hypothetical protein [Halomonas sp. CSM-2]
MTFLSRFFSHVSIKSIKHKNIAPVFLNILMTEVRPVSAHQKLKSFYTIIDQCLDNNNKVNVVIILGKKDNKDAIVAYKESLDHYLKIEGFNLVFVKPTAWSFDRLYIFILMTIYFTKIKGSFEQRFNFACLFSISHRRIKFFRKIYSFFPCDNWLGLTGGIELPVFQSKQENETRQCIINALQFGQASDDQQHFSGYRVNTLFVYDSYSKKIFQNLSMSVKNIVVSGSPEFEYQSKFICNNKLLEEDKLNIVFIDQPVKQRGEYSENFLQKFYYFLQLINKDPDVNIEVKLHPRGSAFNDHAWTDFNITNNFSNSFSRAHVAIGFFSNLCDFALVEKRIAFYVGSEYILNKAKRDWVIDNGGYFVDDVEILLKKVIYLKSQHSKLGEQILIDRIPISKSPSAIIYEKMVGYNDTKTVS